MLAHRLLRWPYIEPALGKCLLGYHMMVTFWGVEMFRSARV